MTRSSSVRGRTDSRRRSRSRAPAARCLVVEGRGNDRRWPPYRGADAPRLPPRHVLGDPPARDRLAVHALCAARRARCRVDSAAGSARAPARRRAPRSLLEALARRDGGRARVDGDAWRRLLGPLVRASDELVAGHARRPVGRRGIRVHMARFGLTALRSAIGLARSPVRGRARPAPLRGERRPRDAPARGARDRVVRPRARNARARSRLAAPARRLTGTCRRTCVVSPLARRRDRDRSHGHLPRRGARVRRGLARRDAEPVPRTRGRRPPGALPSRAREVPVRPGRRQARLRALRARAVAGAGVRERRHPAPRRYAAELVEAEAAFVGGGPPTTVRARRAAEPLRLPLVRPRTSKRCGCTAMCRTVPATAT